MSAKYILPAAALLLLTQCDPGPGPAKGEHSDKVDLIKPVDMKAPPASLEPYAFDIALTLSPAAAAKLARIHEKVEVAAMYSGAPRTPKSTMADDDGQVDLGADRPQFEPVSATVHIPGTGLKTANLQDINGDPIVLVNVYTARKADKDNLLDCGIFEDTIRKAQAQPVQIACKLIYPDPKQGNQQ